MLGQAGSLLEIETVQTTNDSGGLMAAPRRTIKNASDPRGQLGAYLRHRFDTNVDEAAFTKAVGKKPRTIRDWLNGRSGPGFGELNIVANALGLADWTALSAAVKRFHKG